VTTPRLVYFDWTDPAAQEILHPEDVEVCQLDLFGDVDVNWQALRRAHGYQALIRTEAVRRPGTGTSWLPSADFIDGCKELLAVATAGAGYDVVDVEAATDAGIIVCNNTGPGREAVAEHALGLMLALCKKIVLADRNLRSGSVENRSLLKGTELAGKTVGIVGIGNIGARLAEMCRMAFGMEVLAYDPFLTSAAVAERGAVGVSFDELLSRSDFVVATCPLTAETKGLFAREAFAAMKETAFFVTTARGEVHDEVDLFVALTHDQIAGAGLDVFHVEPPPPNTPLLKLDNVVATPHVAGITAEATRALAESTARQWLEIFSGRVPAGLVNPQAWGLYSSRFESVFGRRPDPLPEA